MIAATGHRRVAGMSRSCHDQVQGRRAPLGCRMIRGDVGVAMTAKWSALLSAIGALLVIVGSLGPWFVVATPAIDVEVVLDERGGDWRLGLGLAALALLAIVLAAGGRRGATWPAALYCVGVVLFAGGVDDRRVAL